MNSRSKILSFTFILAISFMFQSCIQDKCENSYTYIRYNPVYMTYEEMREAVASENPKDLNNPGKIYVKDHFLFINELNRGIHVFDNSNPANPVNLAFINIPGNLDLAVKGNILYADSYIDMVAIDISDVNNVLVTKRITDAFPDRVYNHGYSYDRELGVVIAWEPETVTNVYDCQNGKIYNDFQSGTGIVTLNSSSSSIGGSSASASSGTGGSMTRFAIVRDYLYTVSTTSLNLFRIYDPAQPNFMDEIQIGFGIETIFPYNDMLFLGANNGMYIYNNSNPEMPALITMYTHVRSCDPVVVQGNTAYVTLRSGSECQGFTNQLDVIDISNTATPTLVKTYPMHNPHGLGIDGQTLFICDESEGLKVYDASDINKIDENQLSRITSITPIDIIPLSTTKTALVISKQGLVQFDYSDLNNIREISRIQVIL